MSHSRIALRASATVYAVCYFVALFLPRFPEGAYSDDRVTSLFQDPSERSPIILAGYALCLGAVSFLAFMSLVLRTLTPGRSALSGTIRGAGTVYAMVLMLAAVLLCSLPMGVAIGELPGDTDPALYRTLGNAGLHALLVPGLVAAAVVIAAASVELRRAQTAPGWVPVLGFVLAPVVLVGAAWVPQFLVPLWAVAVAYAAPRQVSQADVTNPAHLTPAG